MRRLAAALACALALLSIAAPATADQFELCGVDSMLPIRPEPEQASTNPELTYIAADEAELIEDAVSKLLGNVQIIRGTEQVQADRVEYDRPADVVEAHGNVRYWDEAYYASGTEARMERTKDLTTIQHAEYALEEKHGRGDAETVTISGSDLLRANGASYTTCDPGKDDWIIRASSLRLNKITATGIAFNVLVFFKGVPIFYSPFLSFPLGDERKSGFLFPSLQVSGKNGTVVTIPYYFNLAPNYDATLTANAMTKRGFLLDGELRYLSQNSNGLLNVQFLPNDSEAGKDRSAVSLDHAAQLWPRVRTTVDFSRVSDKNYLEDLGDRLEVTSNRYLNQRADLVYSGNGWWAQGLLQQFQTVDDTISRAARPYKRLPQLLFNTSGTERNLEPNFKIHGEFVNFDHKVRLTGLRNELRPEVSYPVRRAGAFFIPRAKLSYTRYDLSDQDPEDPNHVNRTVPIFSTDSGLIFERDSDIFDQAYVQTLEPRLFYLYVPFKDQDDIPNFDTGTFAFSFSQLFRDNRFSGIDRIGDANQVTLALSSRLLARATGDEVFRASLGQIFYFRDRKVTLPGQEREGRNSSDIVADVGALIANDLRLTAGAQWNLQEAREDRVTAGLRYQPDSGRVLNLSYRFLREEFIDPDGVDQADLSFRWPLGRQWAVVGRWNYGFKENQTLETFGGVEYESCCWAVRAVARRFLTDTDGEFDNAFFLQLELKGLSGIGEKAAAFLEDSIPGYRNNF